MKKFLLIILVIVLFSCVLTTFVGCEKTPREPTPFAAQLLLNKVKGEFLIQDENRVRRVIYNSEFPELFKEDSYYHPIKPDDSYPSYRAILVNEQSQADKIFDNLGTFDFENKMIVVIIFSECEGHRITLENLEVVDDNLVITIIRQSKAQTMPKLVVFPVSLDRIDVDSVSVNFIDEKWRD